MSSGSLIELSVVIPAFNAARYIGECLRSTLAQHDAPAFEVIVVDDGSSDATAAIVDRMFPAVRLLRKANGGPGSARNLGVAEARGDVVIFIDSDDRMLPGRLRLQGDYMLAHPEVGLSFGNQLLQSNPGHDHNGRLGIGPNGPGFAPLERAYARLVVEGNFVANTTSAVRRACYLNVGGQPEDMLVGEDYTMCCAIARTAPVAATRQFLTWYRQGHGGNLMASPHAYSGPMKALWAELDRHGHLLNDAELRAARRRDERLAAMYLRWLWIERGRGALLDALDEYSPHLSTRLRRKWQMLSLCPPSAGRLARSLKRQTVGRLGWRAATA